MYKVCYYYDILFEICFTSLTSNIYMYEICNSRCKFFQLQFDNSKVNFKANKLIKIYRLRI